MSFFGNIIENVSETVNSTVDTASNFNPVELLEDFASVVPATTASVSSENPFENLKDDAQNAAVQAVVQAVDLLGLRGISAIPRGIEYSTGVSMRDFNDFMMEAGQVFQPARDVRDAVVDHIGVDTLGILGATAAGAAAGGVIGGPLGVVLGAGAGFGIANGAVLINQAIEGRSNTGLSDNARVVNGFIAGSGIGLGVGTVLAGPLGAAVGTQIGGAIGVGAVAGVMTGLDAKARDLVFEGKLPSAEAMETFVSELDEDLDIPMLYTVSGFGIGTGVGTVVAGPLGAAVGGGIGAGIGTAAYYLA